MSDFPTFNAKTTAQDAATALAEQIRGKTVLITGTSIGGIGFEAARVLARYAGMVIISGYDRERLRLSAAAIEKEVPSANIRQLVLDLSSLAAVRKAAAEVNAYSEPLHVIIHNAAASGSLALNPTIDGLEPRMATALVGPFLLTKLLARSRPELTARLLYILRLYTPRCGGAKAAGILFASELSRRAGGRIGAYSLHPGAIFTNMNQKGQDKLDLIGMGALTAEGLPDETKFTWKTMGEGAATELVPASTIVAAFDPRLDSKAGAYLDDCVEANEKETASRLWEIAEAIVGEKFAF
ncbi:short-chain dehydrogenase/reductase family protein [Favolaschia claudopus]|uniref:Short-chain dehydrogenase/reductase family protein n=1 Tax=Favolaschia claudopus TaxID=2862362 RepID=A0AAV9ZTG2_9AGAR